jgi:hypothetical protein
MPSGQTAQFELDIRDFVCTLSKIKVSKLTFGHAAKIPKVSFDLSADIKEVETTKGRLRLKYTLYLDANPAVERAELQGEVIITSQKITSVTDLQALGEEKISDIAMQIYAKNYETLYLIFESAGLAAPPPGLIQDVYLAPGLIDLTPQPVVKTVPLVTPVTK